MPASKTLALHRDDSEPDSVDRQNESRLQRPLVAVSDAEQHALDDDADRNRAEKNRRIVSRM